MKVIVHVPDLPKPIHVNVGAGGQTVRWLAGVVARRAFMEARPHGARRMRELTSSPIGKFLPSNFVVTVRTHSPDHSHTR